MTSPPIVAKSRVRSRPQPRLQAPPIVVAHMILPTEDEENLESNRHRLQINVLTESLHHEWRERDDYFAGGNMFVHFDMEVARRRAFRGPDFFVVLDVDGRYPRQAWVTWEEGGRYPDVILELLSETTAENDLNSKKDFYESTFRTAEYFCYDPFKFDSLRGWRLGASQRYEAIAPNEKGWLWSEKLGLWMGSWRGSFDGEQTSWIRFYNEAGELVPTPAEAEAARAETEAARAEAANQQADAERQARLAAEQEAATRAIELARLQSELEKLRAEMARLRGDDTGLTK